MNFIFEPFGLLSRLTFKVYVNARGHHTMTLK